MIIHYKKEEKLKIVKYTLLITIACVLTGCLNRPFFSNLKSMSYESTLTSPNIGYVDFQSDELFKYPSSQVFVVATYINDNNLYDQKRIEITNVKLENGSVRIFIPVLKSEHSFSNLDLIVDYGTVRVIRFPHLPESTWKSLSRGLPIELSDNGQKIIITSEITAPGSYSATMLRRIIQ